MKVMCYPSKIMSLTPVVVFFIILCGIPCYTRQIPVTGDQNSPCPPGHHFSTDRTENSVLPRCKPCPGGTFQKEWTLATRCQQCKQYCYHKYQVVRENCSATQDLTCQCKPGYFWDNYNTYKEGHCREFTPCPNNQVVIKKGTPKEDQKCASCPLGTVYQDQDQKCTSLCDESCANPGNLCLGSVQSLLFLVLMTFLLVYGLTG